MEENSLFWHDTWVGESPLKLVFPRLFAISTQQNASIETMGLWNGATYTWALAWARPLRACDSLERDSLQSILDNVCLSLMNNVTYIWAHYKCDLFTVKSFTLELAKSQKPNHQDTIINTWRGLVPPRVEIFVWLACLSKLNTKAKLAQLNIIPTSPDLCPLCNEHSETSNHLFIHCKFSWQIWVRCHKIWN